ncbi:MAG: hypothetical protein EXS67_04575 [Candidatus Margulisbacteria bacterium]|nr:hypothetical protein [Candidatus Margulisiibacteriota bacterium]
MILIPLACAGLTLLIGTGILWSLHRLPVEKNKTTELEAFISEGLGSFGKRTLSAIIQSLIYVTIVLMLAALAFHKTFSWIQISAFLAGGLFTTSSAYFSLKFSPKMVPLIIKHSKNYVHEGLLTLFQASTAIGLFIVGWVFLGLIATFIILGSRAVIGYGLGMSLAAFFLRIGGGLFKTTTDIGSDNIHALEKNVPNFDTRNPASILDLTGDYIGDIIGFSSDLLSSFAFVIIACILFADTLLARHTIQADTALKLQQLPLQILAIGLIASLIGIYISTVRIKLKVIHNILLESLYITILLCGMGTLFILRYFGLDSSALFPAYLLGLFGAILIGFSSEVLTSSKFSPTKKIAAQAEYGPVISLFNGLSLGLRSNGLFTCYILLMAAGAFYFSGVYGIAIAAMGMLSATPIILSINIFTPLAANTQKMQQLTLDHQTTNKNTKKINEIGHTTAAIGNGFAAGAAILASTSLLFTIPLLNPAENSPQLMINLSLLTGLCLGVSLPFIFSGYLLKGLTGNILGMLKEVSRQFKEIPYLHENKGRPDIIKASDDQARMTMDSLIIPGLLMVLPPILIGYIFGAQMLIGLGLGTALACFSQSFFWANMGDALHNAKHDIENGHFGGKNSPTYTHITIANNIGDGFKDLLSPALNTWLKSVTIIIVLVLSLLAL